MLEFRETEIFTRAVTGLLSDDEYAELQGALIDLATATVRLHERTGNGNLERAIGAARRAAREWPDSPEPLFWEAKCHKLAGREAKAADAFRRFLERARNVSRLKALVAEAGRELSL